MIFTFALPTSAATSQYYIKHLSYSDTLSETHKKINTEVLSTAYRYMDETSYFPNVDAGAMYLVAATSQENMGAGDENVFANIRMTVEIYARHPDAIKGFSSSKRYGLQAYNGYHVGPLSLSPTFLKDGSIGDELGVFGTSEPRIDITGALGDRANWYDTCNMASSKLDEIWFEYYQHSEYRRGFDQNNKYAVVALTAMSMHQGASLLTEADDFMPVGQAENATPQFWFDWCNLMSQQKYINYIRTRIRGMKPSKYNNAEEINDEIIIPMMKSLKAEALRMRPDFFGEDRYQAVDNWISGETEYTSYVGSAGEKTSAAIKVLVSYIIMEERYQGAW